MRAPFREETCSEEPTQVVTLLSWILCSLGIALSQAEQGVIVQGPLQFKAVPALARLSPDELKGAQAVWVWSPLREPRRLMPEELHQQNRRLAGTGRTILVRVPAARQMRTASLRLIAAPVEMWSEVPEPLLPSWPVPKSGRLKIPADVSRPWRLRVAGDEAGSFWTDLPAGAAGAVVSVVAAPGAHSALVVEEGRPAEAASVRVLESGLGRLGGVKEWTFLVGDEASSAFLPSST